MGGDDPEDLLCIEPNDFNSTDKIILGSFNNLFSVLKEKIKTVELEIASELKYFVIEKLRKNIELQPSDIVIRMSYPSGWYAIFTANGKTYAFLYHEDNDTWVTKLLKKPLNYYLSKSS